QLARETFSQMPEEQKVLLRSYSRGVNLALSQNEVSQQDEFVLLDIIPQRWNPWDALTIERLISWIGASTVLTDTTYAAAAQADSALVRFAATDSTFRGFLRLGGFDQSRAWVQRQNEGSSVAHQIVYGNTALPMIQEVSLRVGTRHVLAATITGTFLLPFGQTDQAHWSIFLTANAELSGTESAAPPPQFDRLVDRAGNETLLSFPRSRAGLYFKAQPPAPPGGTSIDTLVPSDSLAVATPDSLLALRSTGSTVDLKTPPAWLVSWAGFAPGSDFQTWISILRSGTSNLDFSLFHGRGIAVQRSGDTTILGSPTVAARRSDGHVFVSESIWATFASDALTSPIPSTTYSPWAAGLVPGMIEALGHRDSLDTRLKDAYAFLRGWNYSYDRESIAASIFDIWAHQFEQSVGQFPSIEPDSLEVSYLTPSLLMAVDHLAEFYGSQPSGWRWGIVQNGERYFPAWSDSVRSAIPRQFEPIEMGPGGHPTAFLTGPAVSIETDPNAASWTGSFSTDSWDEIVVQHEVIETRGFLARSRSLDRPYQRVLRRESPNIRPLILQPGE
ncbi:MAG: penicillin acylase family protein, partial [Rubricoccaceae bacterium]|nr:penicillin acylase family protein [Rubricoccaceae bacterium]